MTENIQQATPDQDPAPPQPGRLVNENILFQNQASYYRIGAAFAGTANPSIVWQQMMDYAPAAMLYYRELQAKDDDIADAIDEVKLSVQKRDWDVTPGDQSSAAVDAAAFVKAQLQGIADFDNLMANMMDAPYYGYTVAESIFDVSMGQASLLDITDVPQDLFCFGPQLHPQIGQLRLKQFVTDIDGTPVDEAKFVVFTPRSRHGNRMGMPILRETYWSSWFKRNIQRFWMRYGEKGPGTAMVLHKEGATEDERRKALAAADAVINDVAVAVSENFQIVKELLTGARAMDPATYEKLYNVLESKIYRRIVGGTLTSHGSDGGKGTQALGNVHQETKEERSVQLAKRVVMPLNRGLIRNLVLWNFGPDCPVPTLGYDIADEADMGERVTTAETVQGMGFEISKKWVSEQFAIPMPESEEDTLQRPAGPAAGTITTPAGSPDKPQFSAAQQDRIDRDQRDLDLLLDELHSQAVKATAKQVKSITEGVRHMQVGGSK